MIKYFSDQNIFAVENFSLTKMFINKKLLLTKIFFLKFSFLQQLFLPKIFVYKDMSFTKNLFLQKSFWPKFFLMKNIFDHFWVCIPIGCYMKNRTSWDWIVPSSVKADSNWKSCKKENWGWEKKLVEKYFGSKNFMVQKHFFGRKNF